MPYTLTAPQATALSNKTRGKEPSARSATPPARNQKPEGSTDCALKCTKCTDEVLPSSLWLSLPEQARREYQGKCLCKFHVELLIDAARPARLQQLLEQKKQWDELAAEAASSREKAEEAVRTELEKDQKAAWEGRERVAGLLQKLGEQVSLPKRKGGTEELNDLKMNLEQLETSCKTMVEDMKDWRKLRAEEQARFFGAVYGYKFSNDGRTERRSEQIFDTATSIERGTAYADKVEQFETTSQSFSSSVETAAQDGRFGMAAEVSAQGAGFIGAGVGAFSTKVASSFHQAEHAAQGLAEQNESSTYCKTMFKMVTRGEINISIKDMTFTDLVTREFGRLVECVKGAKEADASKKIALWHKIHEFNERFGHILCLKLTLGGMLYLKSVATWERAARKQECREGMSRSWNAQVSAGGAYATLFGGASASTAMRTEGGKASAHQSTASSERSSARTSFLVNSCGGRGPCGGSVWNHSLDYDSNLVVLKREFSDANLLYKVLLTAHRDFQPLQDTPEEKQIAEAFEIVFLNELLGREPEEYIEDRKQLRQQLGAELKKYLALMGGSSGTRCPIKVNTPYWLSCARWPAWFLVCEEKAKERACIRSQKNDLPGYSGIFRFQLVPQQAQEKSDGEFYYITVSNPKWKEAQTYYVYMASCKEGYLKTWPALPGPSGEWRIQPRDGGLFMLVNRKYSDWITRMVPSTDYLMAGNVRKDTPGSEGCFVVHPVPDGAYRT